MKKSQGSHGEIIRNVKIIKTAQEIPGEIIRKSQVNRKETTKKYMGILRKSSEIHEHPKEITKTKHKEILRKS